MRAELLYRIPPDVGKERRGNADPICQSTQGQIRLPQFVNSLAQRNFDHVLADKAYLQYRLLPYLYHPKVVSTPQSASDIVVFENLRSAVFYQAPAPRNDFQSYTSQPTSTMHYFHFR
jgi:hypothetical protein